MMSLNLHKQQPYPTHHSHNHHHANHHHNHHNNHSHLTTTTTTTTTRRRTHLKPSQVAVLQESFVTNTLPDASMRAQLAQELGVTERTVQIWFQNRRAKARKLEANTGLPTSLVPNVRTGWIEMPPPSAPTTTTTSQQPTTTQFRSFITPECYENEPNIKRRPRSSSKPEKNTSAFLIPTPPPQRAMSEGMGRIMSGGGGMFGGSAACSTTTTNTTETNKVSFPVNTIRIGSWARFASQLPTTTTTTAGNGEWDLICFSDPFVRQLIWQVQDDGHQFRIEIDYDNIRQIRLGQITDLVGQLEIELIDSFVTSFSMRRHGIDHDWVRCGDFTESQQASTTQDSHLLQGTHDALRQSLLELISQAPDLANKLVIIPDHDFLVRDLTISPSATPEPSSMIAYLHSTGAGAGGNHHGGDFMMPPSVTAATSHVMMMDHKNPSWNNPYYQPHSTPSSVITANQLYDQQQQQQNWTYFNMLQQQSQQQQHGHHVLNSFI